MDLGELVISLRLRTEALEKGLDQTNKKLTESQKAMKDMAQAAKEREREITKAARAEEKAAQDAAKAQGELQGAYTKTSAVAIAAFVGITAAVMGGIRSYNEYTSVMKGFENQIKATGQSVSEAKSVMEDLSSDGLITPSDTAAAIKNLVNYGMTVEQARKTVQALKDTAVDNRQAHYNLGEAVRTTTEGIRMENSVLSDAAGVQKNIAKMKEEYAKSLDKTVDSLTNAEKAEAIYQGVMAESAANMGRAAEYASELGGQQAALAATNLELSQSFGGAMAPVLGVILGLIKPLIGFVTDWTKRNPELTASVVTMAAALAALVGVIGAVAAAKLAWSAATGVLGVALSSLMLNPVVLALTALAGVIAVVSVKMSQASAETKLYEEAQRNLNKAINDGISPDQVNMYEEKATVIKALRDEHIKLTTEIEDANEKMKELEKTVSGKGYQISDYDLKKRAGLDGLAEELKKLEEEFKKAGTTFEESAAKLSQLNAELKKAKAGTTEQVNDQAKQIAMQNRELMTVQNLLKQYNAAEKGSSDWKKAQSDLAKMFPQFSTAIGINEEAIRGLMIVKEAEIKQAWISMQIKAREIIMEHNREIAVKEAAISAVRAGTQWLYGMEVAAAATNKARGEVIKLKGEVASLEDFVTMDISKMPGFVPLDLGDDNDRGKNEEKRKAQEAYQNKQLDDAYRLYEHKKRLNQLTLEQELAALQSISSKYVKTTDERMDLEERLYAVKTAMGDKSLETALKRMEREKDVGAMSENDEIVRLERIKKLYTDSADERQKVDDMIFDATMRKREKQKEYEANVLDETNRMYSEAVEDRLIAETLSSQDQYNLQQQLLTDLIKSNSDYLKSVLADNKYTAQEKKRIEKEITADIRNNINERLQLNRNYNADVRKQNIDDINNLSSGIQAALKEKYQGELSAENDRIKGLLDANETWRKDQIGLIKDAYSSRVKAAEDAAEAELSAMTSMYTAQISAVQNQIKALDDAQKQKSRTEFDEDDEKKINRLNGLIEYERDEFTRAQLQKELNKVMADQQKRHDQEQLDDKKDALRAEEQTLKEQLKTQTEALKLQLADKKLLYEADRDAAIEAFSRVADIEKERLDTMLEKHQEHYKQLLERKNIQAEAEKMIVQEQQTEILKLLEGFGDSYSIAGQSLGEKLFEGFKAKVDQITPLIDAINKQIDNARNATVALATSTKASIAAPTTASSTKTVNVQNTFVAPVTSPSDISKATQKNAQKLL